MPAIPSLMQRVSAERVARWVQSGLPILVRALALPAPAGSIRDGRNPQGTLLQVARFGNPDPSYGLGFPLVGGVELFYQGQSFRWGQGGFAIHPCGLLALVVSALTRRTANSCADRERSNNCCKRWTACLLPRQEARKMRFCSR